MLTTEKQDRIRQLGTAAAEWREKAGDARDELAGAESELWKAILIEWIEGAELDELVNLAEVYGDHVDEQRLNGRQRKEVVNILAAIPEAVAYPNGGMLPGDERPGQAWTADEGSGIKPDQKVAWSSAEIKPMERWVLLDRAATAREGVPAYFAMDAGDNPYPTRDIEKAIAYSSEFEAQQALGGNENYQPQKADEPVHLA
jgi:hypothetical protein